MTVLNSFKNNLKLFIFYANLIWLTFLQITHPKLMCIMIAYCCYSQNNKVNSWNNKDTSILQHKKSLIPLERSHGDVNLNKILLTSTLVRPLFL